MQQEQVWRYKGAGPSVHTARVSNAHIAYESGGLLQAIPRFVPWTEHVLAMAVVLERICWFNLFKKRLGHAV